MMLVGYMYQYPIFLEVKTEASHIPESNVTSEIFARVLFSQNFAHAKFRENIILTNWRNHSDVYLYQ